MNLHKLVILQSWIYNIQFKGYIMLRLILSINSNGEDCTLSFRMPIQGHHTSQSLFLQVIYNINPESLLVNII